MPRSVVCEIKIGDIWKSEKVANVLESRAGGDDLVGRLRCRECRGPVRAHNASGAAEAHFEHHDRHKGCSLGDCFDGTRRRHPCAID